MPEDLSAALQRSETTALEASAAAAPSAVAKVIPKRIACVEIALQDDHGLNNLTDASKVHLRNRLGDFAAQVLRESRSIERAEHVGSGPPEITAAHIDEAWWVSRRRIRHSRHPILSVCTRFVQAAGLAGFGIGATSLKQAWGPEVFVVSALAVVAGILIEAYLARTE
jgi:hypothetical protein